MPDTNQPVRWQPDRAATAATDAGKTWPTPGWAEAIGRGAIGRCPACGQTHAFNGYLRVVPECTACHAPLGEVRADDAPPYFTIFVVGHIVIPLMFWMDYTYNPSVWTLAAVWLPVTTVMSLVLLRPIKGATLGLMLKLGFMKAADE